jgi:hypothetical protein
MKRAPANKKDNPPADVIIPIKSIVFIITKGAIAKMTNE